MSVMGHMILRFSHLVFFTRSEYTFKPLTFAATTKANHNHYCKSKDVYEKNLMRHLECQLIYSQKVCFIFRSFLAALKCCLIYIVAGRVFY